jgi:hypothetical protein
MVEERPHGRTRVRRPEKARLISVGASVSVSADERGEVSRATAAHAGGTAPECTVRLLQRGSGIKRPRGDDGADTGAGEGTVDAGSSNETWRSDAGLGSGRSGSASL